ncbi:MAG: hydantoinase B/oxoprolinase family protein, partial [Chloroflexi bacterium]|nr:hydantoinase B/oxoprolinase family protein [Chloroflexota bacterium]
MATTNVDPTTLAVLQGAFVSIAHDMSRLLIRTSQNFITAELRDHHTGVYDARGRVLASSLTLPALAGAGRLQAQLAAEKFKDDIYPGDEFVMNCAYTAYGTHLPDWSFVRPVFYQDELLFMAFSKAHQLDTSGAYPGGYFPRAYDIHAEGLMIPCIKWTEKGVPNRGVQELILNNVRYKDRQRLDVAAMFASLKLCEERVIKLLDKYGKETVMQAVDDMIEVMYRTVKGEIGRMADGTFYGEAACDDDGSKVDKPVWVRCKMIKQGENLHFDLSESDPQCDFVNSPWANTQ